jgi:hypothetical protein
METLAGAKAEIAAKYHLHYEARHHSPSTHPQQARINPENNYFKFARQKRSLASSFSPCFAEIN